MLLTPIKAESIQELRTTVAKRDFENARVREERDRAKGELKLAERKIADLMKQQATEELRALADARLVRILLSFMPLSHTILTHRSESIS